MSMAVFLNLTLLLQKGAKMSNIKAGVREKFHGIANISRSMVLSNNTHLISANVGTAAHT